MVAQLRIFSECGTMMQRNNEKLLVEVYAGVVEQLSVWPGRAFT